MKSFLNLRASVACLCLLTVAGNGAAQTEDDKSNLFTKAKAFLNRSVVHGVDTNYVKTPAQPWQVSVKSRVAQTDLQMHSVIDGTDLFDGERVMPFMQGPECQLLLSRRGRQESEPYAQRCGQLV